VSPFIAIITFYRRRKGAKRLNADRRGLRPTPRVGFTEQERARTLVIR